MNELALCLLVAAMELAVTAHEDTTPLGQLIPASQDRLVTNGLMVKLEGKDWQLTDKGKLVVGKLLEVLDANLPN